MNLIDVVQRDVHDGDAADEDGFQIADRCDFSALAYLPTDIAQDRRLLLGFVFEGDDPARRFAVAAELISLGEAVDLEHHAIGHVGKRRSNFLEFVNDADRVVDRVDTLRLSGQRKIPFPEATSSQSQ